MSEKANSYLYKLKRKELTFADMKFMSQLRSAGITDAEVVDWLDRVVEGGVMHLPMDQFGEVYVQVFKQFYDVEDPDNSEGKV